MGLLIPLIVIAFCGYIIWRAGDSFVEGVGLEYQETIVGHLNKKIRGNNIENYEFLNAGVTSYSSYIYFQGVYWESLYMII